MLARRRVDVNKELDEHTGGAYGRRRPAKERAHYPHRENTMTTKAEMQTQIEELERRLAEAEAQAHAATDEKRAFKARVTELEAELKTANEKIAQLQAFVDSVREPRVSGIKDGAVAELGHGEDLAIIVTALEITYGTTTPPSLTTARATVKSVQAAARQRFPGDMLKRARKILGLGRKQLDEEQAKQEQKATESAPDGEPAPTTKKPAPAPARPKASGPRVTVR